MASRVKAKFSVGYVKAMTHGSEVHLNAVHPGNNEGDLEEHKKFWEATPNGQITMTIKNSAAAEDVQPGDFHYVTFERADAAAQVP